jgi:hypothetical protein
MVSPGAWKVSSDESIAAEGGNSPLHANLWLLLGVIATLLSTAHAMNLNFAQIVQWQRFKKALSFLASSQPG